MLLLPSLVLLLLFFIGPILLTGYFAFTNIALTGTASQAVEFIGFKNFVMMFSDPNFKSSIIATIIFLLFSGIIGQQVLGFIIALLMKQKKVNFRRFVGICVMAGWITPEIICAFAWVAFLGDNGTLNNLINILGFEPITWMYTFPLVSVIIANIWHGSAFSMLIYQAALDDVPRDIEEAAMIDGASSWQRLVRIVLPLIKGPAATNMVIVTLNTLGVFTLIYTMTGGGPGNATMTLPVFMYNQAFINYQLGYGTAISLIMLIIGIFASLIYIKLMKVEV
nr:sugar ABC transporter permease [Bacillus timonensis]